MRSTHRFTQLAVLDRQSVVEAEHFDFGLLVANISRDPDREKVILGTL